MSLRRPLSRTAGPSQLAGPSRLSSAQYSLSLLAAYAPLSSSVSLALLYPALEYLASPLQPLRQRTSFVLPCAGQHHGPDCSSDFGMGRLIRHYLTRALAPPSLLPLFLPPPWVPSPPSAATFTSRPAAATCQSPELSSVEVVRGMSKLAGSRV